jgi:hypothetical protein
MNIFSYQKDKDSNPELENHKYIYLTVEYYHLQGWFATNLFEERKDIKKEDWLSQSTQRARRRL